MRTIPSRWLCLLGALLAAAGLAVFVVLQISTTDPDYRMVLPGSQEIELDKGDYTLFYEHQTVFNASAFSTDPNVPAIRFFVMPPTSPALNWRPPAPTKHTNSTAGPVIQ